MPSMKAMSHQDLKEFLEEKVRLYNRPDFIPLDPVSIPHLFSKKEDIEIANLVNKYGSLSKVEPGEPEALANGA